MTCFRFLAAVALAAAAASAAGAAPKEFDSVSDKPKVTLDPAAAYLLVQTSSDVAGAVPMTFIREPDAAAIADYRARRAAALDKAHGKWVKVHAQWVIDIGDWKKGKMPGQAKPEEPVEPTDANLAFPSLASENIVTLGPLYRFSKTGGRSTYLERMKPGRYIFYGPLATFPETTGTCLCMGSIAFEVKPGVITNAGMMKLNLVAAREAAKAEGKEMPKTELDLPESLNGVGWQVPADVDAIDPRLAGYKVVPAEIRAYGRIPNFFGVAIDRMTEIPGLLAYERDRVVDAKSGETAPAFMP